MVSPAQLVLVGSGMGVKGARPVLPTHTHDQAAYPAAYPAKEKRGWFGGRKNRGAAAAGTGVGAGAAAAPTEYRAEPFNQPTGTTRDVEMAGAGNNDASCSNPPQQRPAQSHLYSACKVLVDMTGRKCHWLEFIRCCGIKKHMCRHTRSPFLLHNCPYRMLLAVQACATMATMDTPARSSQLGQAELQPAQLPTTTTTSKLHLHLWSRSCAKEQAVEPGPRAHSWVLLAWIGGRTNRMD